MRIGTWVAATAVLLAGAPAALAHEGSPNFLSQVNSIMPADGIAVEVLNRDDRLLLRNDSGRTVVIEGYSGEPYASSSSVPLPAIFAFAALVIVLSVAVAIKRRRRAPAQQAW